MDSIDFNQLRRDLDDAITYADFEKAGTLARLGLDKAHCEERLGEIMYFRAQEEIINEKFEKAVHFLTLAIQYNPLDGAAYNDRALCGLELGNDGSQSLADFDKGIEVEPDYATIYHNKGWYLNQCGRHREAIAYFEKTLELEPGRAVTYENLGDAYLNLGEKHNGLEALRKSIEYLAPAYTEIKRQLEDRIKELLTNN